MTLVAAPGFAYVTSATNPISRSRVSRHDKRRRLDEAQEAALGVEYRSLNDLLKESDFVSINAALSPETVHLIGDRELRLMRPSAYLINTARGPIVDEKALVQALEEKRIAGAALNVYEREPLVEPG